MVKYFHCSNGSFADRARVLTFICDGLLEAFWLVSNFRLWSIQVLGLQILCPKRKGLQTLFPCFTPVVFMYWPPKLGSLATYKVWASKLAKPSEKKISTMNMLPPYFPQWRTFLIFEDPWIVCPSDT